MGQHGCAGHVQPLQPACDTNPTLIEMDDRGRDELLADVFQSGVSSGDKLTGGCEHDRLASRKLFAFLVFSRGGVAGGIPRTREGRRPDQGAPRPRCPPRGRWPARPDSFVCLSSDHRCWAACRCCEPVDPAVSGSTPVAAICCCRTRISSIRLSSRELACSYSPLLALLTVANGGSLAGDTHASLSVRRGCAEERLAEGVFARRVPGRELTMAE